MNNMMVLGGNDNGNNGSWNPGNIDLDKLLLLSQQNMMQITAFNEGFKNIGTELKHITSSVNGLNDNVSALSHRMDVIETKEEITTEQAETLKASVHARVLYLLNYDDEDVAKYKSTLISWCYTDCKRNAGMGHKFAATRKENYLGLLDYIETWRPVGGMAAFKAKVDKNAEENRKAKELGYK